MVASLIRKTVLSLVALVVINAAAFVITSLLFPLWEAGGGVTGGGNIAVVDQPPAVFDLDAVWQNYLKYAQALASGDPGTTKAGDSVASVVAEAIPKSLVLLGLALLGAGLFGMAGGMLSVSRETRQLTPLGLTLSMLGFSMPGFYLAIVVTYGMIAAAFVYGPQAMIFPILGYGLDKHLVLPLLALMVRPAAEVARITAELLAEEYGQNYIVAARARGLPWRRVVLRHAFSNIASSVSITLGNSLRYVLSSLVLIEGFFQWPGIGRLVAENVMYVGYGRPASFDPAMMAALMSVLAILMMGTGMAISLFNSMIDPRLRRDLEGA
jgi:peptide/nickel transport system permease protein